MNGGRLPAPDEGFYRKIFSRLPELTTERLTLRPMRRGDARDLYAYASDPEVARHVLWSAHRDLDESREMIRAARRQYRHGWPASYAITMRDSGRMVGTIGFMWLNVEHRSAEVGYSLARDCWGRGLMTEALRAVTGFAFDTLRLNRLEAQHELDNPASGRVMEKCGFRPEGVLRSRLNNKGRFVDVKLWSLIRADLKQTGGGEDAPRGTND